MATTTSVLGLTKPAYSEAADVSVLNSDMDLIDAEAGRVRGNIAANYSASSAYAVGDLCLYTGVLYRCKTAIGSGGEAWNSGHWDAVKIAGQLSALSDQIANILGIKYKFITMTFTNGIAAIDRSELTSRPANSYGITWGIISAIQPGGWYANINYYNGDDKVRVVCYQPTANGNTLASDGDRQVLIHYWEK